MGLAYKANTGDARETPSIPICAQLVELGASVAAADPHVPTQQFPAGVERVDGDRADIEAADLVIYLVDHAVFDRDALAAATVPVLDCQRALVGHQVHRI
jgi:UDP-N-acetyl-D-mannosaminuronic acid dehydrogenase/UDP-N-acetyl-D-glucosamine dehydrogenase